MEAIVRSKLAVVDDHPLFRAGLVAALRDEIDLEVVAQTGSLEETRALSADLDLATVDLLMPEASGLSIIAALHGLQPRCHILVLSVIDEPCVIADVLRAGASGYALKTQPPQDIIAAIRHVLGGVRYLPPTVSRDAIDRELAIHGGAPAAPLTDREREVFELVIRGMRTSDIAAHLQITVRTAETHCQRLRHKLATHTIAQIRRVAAVHGWHG